MYGVDGTMTIAGGIGDSGTLEKTLAANPLKAVDKAARVSAIELAGIIDKLFLRQDTAEAMKTPYSSMIYPCGTAYFENQHPGFLHQLQRGFGTLQRLPPKWLIQLLGCWRKLRQLNNLTMLQRLQE
jgi:hypothetical protein